MPEVICNTSPLQYLHQLGLLYILPRLCGHVVVPPGVVEELAAGRKLGVDLPYVADLEWVDVRTPVNEPVIPLASDLGVGETGVLALALESPGATTILDDGLARRVAKMLGIQVRGTLGLLLDAKKAAVILAVAPQLDQLQCRGFRLSPETRTAVLDLAGELPGF